MEERLGERIVFKAERGIQFDLQRGADGEIIIFARRQEISNDYLKQFPNISAGEYADKLSVYTDGDGHSAIVPAGWTVSGVSKENQIWGKNTGLVIYRIPREIVTAINWEDERALELMKKNYDQFVWVPVSLLKSNGTIDGVSFTERFGRRNYCQNIFSKAEFHESFSGELEYQYNRVKQLAGFYFSRYDLSKDMATGVLRSIKGKMPCLDTGNMSMVECAAKFEQGESVRSHLPFGSEYDSALEWVIETGTKSLLDISENSASWGNYNNTRGVVETGSREDWAANNICDLAGNIAELTQEEFRGYGRVARGGYCYEEYEHQPVAYRSGFCSSEYMRHTGFRVVLRIL